MNDKKRVLHVLTPVEIQDDVLVQVVGYSVMMADCGHEGYVSERTRNLLRRRDAEHVTSCLDCTDLLQEQP